MQHRFIWEYTRLNTGEIEAHSFSWEPRHSEPITPEDLEVLGYVEQYLDTQGMAVDRTLSEGMYRPMSENEFQFEADASLDIEFSP